MAASSSEARWSFTAREVDACVIKAAFTTQQTLALFAETGMLASAAVNRWTRRTKNKGQ